MFIMFSSMIKLFLIILEYLHTIIHLDCTKHHMYVIHLYGIYFVTTVVNNLNNNTL